MRKGLTVPFGPLLTAMATPMRADRSLDLDGAQRLARHLVDTGSDGIVVCGTTGEAPTLTHDETRDMFRAVQEAVGGEAAVVAGTGKNDTAATIEGSREAAELGVDGLLVVTPYYNKPSQRGLAHHLTEVARCVDLPIIVYDIPGRTACRVELDTLLRVIEAAPNVRGIKDAAKDFDRAGEIAARTPEDFCIYAGNDIDLLPLLALGGHGVISVAGHVVGRELDQLIDSFPKDPAAAQALHHRLLPLFSALFCDTNPVPLKAALNEAGLPGGPVRPPLADPDDAVTARVRDALAVVEGGR